MTELIPTADEAVRRRRPMRGDAVVTGAGAALPAVVRVRRLLGTARTTRRTAPSSRAYDVGVERVAGTPAVRFRPWQATRSAVDRVGTDPEREPHGGLAWTTPGVGSTRHTGRVAAGEEKTCASCGRRIEWRRSLAKNWDDVRYCSDACRRRKVTSVDRRLEELLRALLDRGGRGGIDPDQAARCIDPHGWKELHEPARRAARRLVAAGVAEMVQGGRVVDPSTARGEVRIRLV